MGNYLLHNFINILIKKNNKVEYLFLIRTVYWYILI